MFIGTAGWSIPKISAEHFLGQGTHLQRYGQCFNAVEINSSFYREHLPRSYIRWASEVPDHFRFSVKLSRTFIHDCALKPRARDLFASLETIQLLGEKLGVILIQLPASMEFHPKKAERFYQLIRKKYPGPLVLEARNLSWLERESQKLMQEFNISKVLADPEQCPGGPKRLNRHGGVTYYRLHGSPIIYRSSYSKLFLKKLAKEISGLKNVWCIFDNTAFGAATENALDFKHHLTLATIR